MTYYNRRVHSPSKKIVAEGRKRHLYTKGAHKFICQVTCLSDIMNNLNAHNHLQRSFLSSKTNSKKKKQTTILSGKGPDNANGPPKKNQKYCWQNPTKSKHVFVPTFFCHKSKRKIRSTYIQQAWDMIFLPQKGEVFPF